MVPAIIAGVATMAAGSMSKSATKETNRTNMQIAQMNNEWSERMMDKQMAYEERMWNQTNEYNSAINQRKRLEEAGLNPYMMLGGGDAGSAGSAGSPSLPSPSTPQITAPSYGFFSDAINNAMAMYQQRQKQNAEIESIYNQIDLQKALVKAQIAELEAKTSSQKFKNHLDEITKDITIGNRQEDYLMRVQNRVMADEQTKLIQQQRLTQKLINLNLPEKLSQEIAVMVSQENLNKWNSDVQVGKYLEAIKKRGYNLSPWQEKAIFGALIAAQAYKAM